MTDEAYSRLKEQAEKKKLTKAKKGKEPVQREKKRTAASSEEKDENVCQGCYGHFQDDSHDRQEIGLAVSFAGDGFIVTVQD